MSTAQKETIAISGMSCEHCVQAVREALSHLEGVTVEDVEIGAATVSYGAPASREDIIAAIETAGYSPAA